MRHSFLPQYEQKILKHGYRVHLIVAILFLLSGVGIMGIIFLFPAYVYVSMDRENQNTLLISSKKRIDTAGIVDYEKDFKLDLVLLNTVSDVVKRIQSSDLIEKVVSVRSSVKITSIAIVSVSTTTAKIIVQGVSPTRESLLLFKGYLEKLAPDNKVELPLSEFTKNKDITFSLNLIHTLQ
jgi:hypothetical protein